MTNKNGIKLISFIFVRKYINRAANAPTTLANRLLVVTLFSLVAWKRVVLEKTLVKNQDLFV